MVHILYTRRAPANFYDLATPGIFVSDEDRDGGSSINNPSMLMGRLRGIRRRILRVGNRT
ncbi:hypothetical protein H5T87_09010 [bacterium]|nr:hypothetical protein [bacterium]